jgi:deoxyribonuclease-1-like protein
VSARRSALVLALSFALFSCLLSFGSPAALETDPGGSPDPSRILIGSFNLQVFGTTKAAKTEILSILARIIRHYDVIAVQEIRDSSGTAVVELKNAVNSAGAHYECLVGPRLGRSSSKEQYAYFYKTSTIESSAGAYTFDERGTDTFEREPFIAHFKARHGSFDFTLVDIHTKPDDAMVEIAYLPNVISEAQTHTATANVICLGDFNADGAYFDETGYTSVFPPATYNWLIANTVDTTQARSSNTYDRMVSLVASNREFDGTAGVYRYDQVLSLDSHTSSQVSDHYPVFAEFRVNPKGAEQ